MNERIMKTISIWRSYVKNFRVYVLSCHRVVHTPGTLYGDVSTAHKHGDAVHVCGEVRQISRYTRQRQVPSDVRLISAHMNDESDQIRSSVNSSRNLQQTDCHIAHHTLNVATLPCEMTVVTNSHFHIKTMHLTSIVTNQMSYCQFMMKFKCKLQRLFEMSPFRTDTGTKSRMPLIDRVVDDALLQTGPHVYRSHQFRGSYAAVF